MDDFERQTKNGFVYIKVNGEWIREHLCVYEQYYGIVPKGMVILHINGNLLDSDPDNLACVNRLTYNKIKKGWRINEDGKWERPYIVEDGTTVYKLAGYNYRRGCYTCQQSQEENYQKY